MIVDLSCLIHVKIEKDNENHYRIPSVYGNVAAVSFSLLLLLHQTFAVIADAVERFKHHGAFVSSMELLFEKLRCVMVSEVVLAENNRMDI